MEIKGNVTINISFTKHANIQFNTFLGFSGPFLGVFCFSTPLVKHKLHLKYAKLLYTARARERAHRAIFWNFNRLCRWWEVFGVLLFKNSVSYPLYFFRHRFSLDFLRPISNWGRYLYIWKKYPYAIRYEYFRKLTISSFSQNISHIISKFEPIPYETQSAQDWVQRPLVRNSFL